MAAGGIYLVILHGSLYFLLCGSTLIVSAALLWKQRREGAALYLLAILATLAWTIWECGYDAWVLISRMSLLVLVGAISIIPVIWRALAWRSLHISRVHIVGLALVTPIVGTLLRTVARPAVPVDPVYQVGSLNAESPRKGWRFGHSPVPTNGDWREYGGDIGGTRFSALGEITPSNVAQLKLVWRYRRAPHSVMETTPLKIDRTLYFCTGHTGVTALDAETGVERWRFTGTVNADGGPCRGVAYYRNQSLSGPCAERIISVIVSAIGEANLVAVDIRNGTPCRDFGKDGKVSLLVGMGEVPPFYYSVTSAPVIVRGKVIIGGSVLDGQYWGEPSGVIRAFDAVTGKFDWAWDMGHPENTREPPPGEIYTQSTPNSWAPMSADEILGLVFVPTGNATGSDFFGGYRRAFDNQYSSSLVALDAMTGEPRWSFQTTHHDLWDYDVASQPTLFDYLTASGVVHAVLQPTKRGELFILDRASGKPLRSVVERPAPRSGQVPEERLSPTQPFSIDLPSFRGPDLVEGAMWGITPLDQLWCRIKFRQARYDGPLTAPGLTPSIQLPGVLGGIDWGGVAVDTDRGIAIVNSNSLPDYVRLIGREEVEQLGLRRLDARQYNSTESNSSESKSSLLDDLRNIDWSWAQEGLPYGALQPPFLSPLKIPCNPPPYGRLSAVDLNTGKLMWTRPFGTTQHLGPWGIPTLLPLPLGTPNIGGALVTRGGVILIGAAMDKYLHAYSTETGELLWRTPLPDVGNATPITYFSRESGRQFVVISALDSILAFALPKRSGE